MTTGRDRSVPSVLGIQYQGGVSGVQIRELLKGQNEQLHQLTDRQSFPTQIPEN